MKNLKDALWGAITPACMLSLAFLISRQSIDSALNVLASTVGVFVFCFLGFANLIKWITDKDDK